MFADEMELAEREYERAHKPRQVARGGVVVLVSEEEAETTGGVVLDEDEQEAA